MRHLRVTTALLLAAAIATPGCSGGGDTLDGTEWQLTGWSVSSIDPAHVSITARFDDGKISGSSGVNSYSGPVKVGAGGSFAARPLAGTKMAGPEQAMRAEGMYLILLQGAGSYQVNDATLILADEGGNESLIFARVAER